MKYLLLSVAAMCLLHISTAAQLTHESYKKARPVLDRAIAAYGGLTELRAIENVTFKLTGDTVHRNQSKKTFGFDRTPFKAEYIIDPKNTRYRQQQDGHYPGGFDWVNGFAINKAEGVTWDNLRGSFSPVPNVPIQNFRGRLRMFPHFIVLNAAERSSRARYLGSVNLDGRAHDVISYANEDGVETSLYIDQKGLLSKVEFMTTDPYMGDAVTEIVFGGYRQENGRVVPGTLVNLRSGELMNDYKYSDVVFNAALTDENFKIPAGLTLASPQAGPPQPITKYGDNVYTVNAGGYNVLAVGFKDHIFVMEAPGNDNVSRQAITEIKKLFPGKPIRYFAVSHHHDDHAGGLRTYVAEGPTLIALPGEKTFFEKVMTGKFTIDVDSLTLNPKPLKMELIEKGKRVLTDGTTTVELIDIGPGGHTDEMLVAYLPSEKIIFQGDLLNRPANNDPATVNASTVHFSEWLDRSGLNVERVVGVHGPPSTRDELRQGVAKFKKP